MEGYQILLHRFRELADRYEIDQEEEEKINAFILYFRKTFVYQDSLVRDRPIREQRYSVKMWNSFASIGTNEQPITNNDAEGSNARYNQHFGGLQKPLRSKVIEWMKSRVQAVEYDIERYEDRPADIWVCKTRRQQYEESNLRRLLSAWALVKSTIEPGTVPENSKYIEFLQSVYEIFLHRHLLASIEPFQLNEERVEVDEIEMMGINVDDLEPPPNEQFPEDENFNETDLD